MPLRPALTVDQTLRFPNGALLLVDDGSGRSVAAIRVGHKDEGGDFAGILFLEGDLLGCLCRPADGAMFPKYALEASGFLNATVRDPAPTLNPEAGKGWVVSIPDALGNILAMGAWSSNGQHRVASVILEGLRAGEVIPPAHNSVKLGRLCVLRSSNDGFEQE